MTIDKNPERIWLSPICDLDAHHGDGRSWASPAPERECEDCGQPWVEYVRADLAAFTDAQQEPDTTVGGEGREELIAKLEWALNGYKLAEDRLRLMPTLTTAMSCSVEITDINAKLGELLPDILATLSAETALSGKDGAGEAIRPEVMAFAELMEAQLRANDHKPGWKDDDWRDLMARLEQERVELHNCIDRAPRYPVMEAGREAADVANFAMMIADVCGALQCEDRESHDATPDTMLRSALEREAVLMVAIEKLATIVSYETPDDLTPAEVDDQRYRAASPILKALGMEIAGGDDRDDPIGWGFDWPTELADAEKVARQALAQPKGDRP